MTQVLGKTFLWPDDDEVEAVLRRALAITAAIAPAADEWPEVFRAAFTLASQAHVEMMQQGPAIDLSRLPRGLG